MCVCDVCRVMYAYKHKLVTSESRRDINDITRHIWLRNERFLDKLHELNHKEDCQAEYGSRKHKRFAKTNTQACESFFRWLGQFKHMTCNMNETSFDIFVWGIMLWHNVKMERVLVNSALLSDMTVKKLWLR